MVILTKDLIMSNRLSQILKSRTFWATVLMVFVNTVNANASLLDQHTLDVVNAILGIAVTYFHINPSQDYTVKKK